MGNTVKQTITIPTDLKQAVEEYANGQKFSTTVCNLIRLALYGNQDIPTGISGISETEYNKVIQRLEALESAQCILSRDIGKKVLHILGDTGSIKLRISDLESGKNTGCAGIIPDKSNTSVTPEVIPKERRVPIPDPIPITDEMRANLIENMKGMTRKQIVAVLNLSSKSRVSEISSGVLKNISRSGYEALMSRTD